MSLYAGAAAIIALSSSWALAGNFQLLGYLGCLLAVILTGSPLITLATVIKDKSTAALPILMSLSAFLNSASWSAYGIQHTQFYPLNSPSSYTLTLPLNTCILYNSPTLSFFKSSMSHAYIHPHTHLNHTPNPHANITSTLPFTT